MNNRKFIQKGQNNEHKNGIDRDFRFCRDHIWTSILPFLVFQEGKELPDQIKRLGMVLPSSIMAVLIVYCLKDVGDDFMADGLWKLIAAAITAVSYRWKHNTLISILLGTVSYMMFLHFLDRTDLR